MARILETLRAGARTRFGSWRSEGRAAVARLPVYQVALWPDGWELGRDGSVRVLDTHEMAEARRWYALAERNQYREDASKVMALYGIFVPPRSWPCPSDTFRRSRWSRSHASSWPVNGFASVEPIGCDFRRTTAMDCADAGCYSPHRCRDRTSMPPRTRSPSP